MRHNLFIHSKVQFLLKNARLDDIQIQTTKGIKREKYLKDFENACVTLSQTIFTRFPRIHLTRVNSNIGAALLKGGPSCGWGCYYPMNNATSVGTCVMSSFDISDVHSNFRSYEYDKVQTIGPNSIVFNQRIHSIGRGGGGQGDKKPWCWLILRQMAGCNTRTQHLINVEE